MKITDSPLKHTPKQYREQMMFQKKIKKSTQTFFRQQTFTIPK